MSIDRIWKKLGILGDVEWLLRKNEAQMTAERIKSLKFLKKLEKALQAGHKPLGNGKIGHPSSMVNIALGF